MLLGKAGLLERRRFCHGVFEEFLEEFPVVPREGVVRAKLVEDGNLVTAQSDAFREFAAATVLARLRLRASSRMGSRTQRWGYRSRSSCGSPAVSLPKKSQHPSA